MSFEATTKISTLQVRMMIFKRNSSFGHHIHMGF